MGTYNLMQNNKLLLCAFSEKRIYLPACIKTVITPLGNVYHSKTNLIKFVNHNVQLLATVQALNDLQLLQC